MSISRILLPTDFSEPALAATNYALELAKQFGAELHLLHVIEDPIAALPMFDSCPVPSGTELEEYAKTRLENWILPDDAAEVQIQTRWAHGTPFVNIVQDAREHDIDLIVVGTHGHGLVAHILMGSTAERVVQKAQCPVLTVRPDGHQFIHPADD